MEIEDTAFDITDKENAHSLRSFPDRASRPRAALADITHQFVPATPLRRAQIFRSSLLLQKTKKPEGNKKKLPR